MDDSLVRQILRRGMAADINKIKRLRQDLQLFKSVFAEENKWLRKALKLKTGPTPAAYIHLFANAERGEPRCMICRTRTTWDRSKKTFHQYCSGGCAAGDEITKAKKAATNMERYGASYPRGNTQIDMKARKTIASQADFYKRRAVKTIATCEARYGVSNGSKTDEAKSKISTAHTSKSPNEKRAVREKHEATLVERYGSISQSYKQAAKKGQKTIVARYGKQRHSIKVAYRKTMQERYGVSYALQDPELFDRQQKARYRRKQVVVQGITHEVQGYEHVVLATLADKLTKCKTEPASMPAIYYTKNGRQARYFPDALVKTKKGNRAVLEVKSEYTLTANRAINRRKFKAALKWCKEHGYQFVLAIADAKSVLRWYYNEEALGA